MTRPVRPARLAFATCAVCLAAGGAGAELAKWDQARVTQIAPYYDPKALAE
jgi:hypothetical protein